MLENKKIAVVIPCYRVKKHIAVVIAAIPAYIDGIICVDDKCPDSSGDFIKQNFTDPRITVLRCQNNQGVGGAMITGYTHAVSEGFDILVKIDGDDQMDTSIMHWFIHPVLEGVADYTKGNRFWYLSHAKEMPMIRFLGNIVLSLLTKASSGYWHIFDPTNGYTAIDARTFSQLPSQVIARRYFFESDMLHHLGLIRAVVTDIPMRARYGDEVSGLKINKILFDFLFKHMKNIFRRVWYQYFLRDFNYGSLCLILGSLLMIGGVIFGGKHWIQGYLTGELSTAGTVAIAALLLASGLYFLLSFARVDMENEPRTPLSRYLPNSKKSFRDTSANASNSPPASG